MSTKTHVEWQCTGNTWSISLVGVRASSTRVPLKGKTGHSCLKNACKWARSFYYLRTSFDLSNSFWSFSFHSKCYLMSSFINWWQNYSNLIWNARAMRNRRIKRKSANSGNFREFKPTFLENKRLNGAMQDTVAKLWESTTKSHNKRAARSGPVQRESLLIS